ncbi:MAG TPA: anti-phage BREX system Lon protease BrxL, partial [Planctomycetota bacterium]|nr:anti-phage BREX system Lon protease BrxL [Planctomycetota bacterium]
MRTSEPSSDGTHVDDVALDDLDRKLLDAFSGRVVRKDLVKRLKVGFNVPVYVLE